MRHLWRNPAGRRGSRRDRRGGVRLRRPRCAGPWWARSLLELVTAAAPYSTSIRPRRDRQLSRWGLVPAPSCQPGDRARTGSGAARHGVTRLHDAVRVSAAVRDCRAVHEPGLISRHRPRCSPTPFGIRDHGGTSIALEEAPGRLPGCARRGGAGESIRTPLEHPPSEQAGSQAARPRRDRQLSRWGHVVAPSAPEGCARRANGSGHPVMGACRWSAFGGARGRPGAGLAAVVHQCGR